MFKPLTRTGNSTGRHGRHKYECENNKEKNTFSNHCSGRHKGLCELVSFDTVTRRVRRGGGGVHWVHMPPPPPTWEKVPLSRKCPKEERKFRPDMTTKKNVHVPLICHKIRTKKVRKKEDISKRLEKERVKIKEIKKENSRLSELYRRFFSRLFTIIVVLNILNKLSLLLYLFSSFIVLYLTFLNDYSSSAEPVRTF